jgi:mannosyltransferase
LHIVYDNIIYSLQNAGGISAYWCELSKRINVYDAEFFGFDNINMFYQELSEKQKQESNLHVKIARYLYFQKLLPKGSIFHSSYYRIADQKDIVNITTVHDFIYEYYSKGLARLVHSWQKGRAINKSDGIICISENTKKDLLNFYPHINDDKIKVIYLGANDAFRLLENPENALEVSFEQLVNKKYVLYVGDRSCYKNFDLTVKSIKKLGNITLVIVGGGKLSLKEKKQLKCLDYKYYSYLSVAELNILYNNAFCFMYPSSYEGFGIPVLEAMKSGCPVVSNNISSIPEVAGDAALLVNVLNTDELVKALIRLQDELFRQKLIQKGLEQASKFSWDKCFNETFDFYKEVASKKFS